MNSDAVVEIDGVVHATELALATASHHSVVLVDTARCPRQPAPAFLDRLEAFFVTGFARIDGDFFAPFLIVTRRDVCDEHRVFAMEHDHHLFGQVDLGVIGRRVGTAWLDDQGILHAAPHLGRDLAGHLIARNTHHQFLERPHGLLCALAESAVGHTRVEVQLDETVLNDLDLGTRGTTTECLRQRKFLHGRCGVVDHHLGHGRRGGFGRRRRLVG